MNVLVGEFAPTVCRRDTPPSASASLGRSGRVTPHSKANFLFKNGVSVAGCGRRAGRGSIAAATRPRLPSPVAVSPSSAAGDRSCASAVSPWPPANDEPGRLYPSAPRLGVPCGIPKSALLAALRRSTKCSPSVPARYPRQPITPSQRRRTDRVRTPRCFGSRPVR